LTVARRGGSTADPIQEFKQAAFGWPFLHPYCDALLPSVPFGYVLAIAPFQPFR
jgi:hypothetical protein